MQFIFIKKKKQISVSMLFQVDGVALSQSQHLGRIEGSDSLNIHRPHKDRSTTRQKSDFRSSIFSFPISHRMDSQQPNNGFGPLSKRRGSGAVFGAFLVVAVSGAVHIVNAIAFSSIKESKDEILFSELVRRVCLVNEERRHRHTRYEGSWKKLLNSTFTFRYGHSILVVGVVSFLTVFSFVLYYALYEDCKTFCRSEYWILFSLNCFLAPQLSFLVGLREPSSAEVSQINERENKNVADGLAWSYYFGYLKMVLPKLVDNIGQSNFRYDITEKRLFILIPKNCFTYNEIKNADGRIKSAGNLEPYETHRGGISKRRYLHTVHRIEMPRPDGEVDKYYVVLECATPLMSLYDMSQHSECGLSRQERDEQVT